MTERVLAAAHVLPIDAPPLSPGWVRIAAGRIAEIGEGPPPPDRGEVEDLGPAFLLPGFVNAHAHLGCHHLRGAGSGDLPFWRWMSERVLPALGPPHGEDHRRAFEAAAAAAVRELLAAGVTGVADAFFADAGRTALERAGLPGVFHREVFGASEPDLDAYAERVRAGLARDRRRSEEALAADQAGGPKTDRPAAILRAGISPHAPYTCPPRILDVCAEESERAGASLSMHLAETAEEARFVRDGEGPVADRLRRRGLADRFRRARSPIALAAEHGILTPRTLVVHAVHVDAADLDLIAASGATVAHCPASNARLGVGLAPVAAMQARGIPLALGTDSGASNGKLDPFEEMRLAVLLPRSAHGDFRGPDAATVLTWATLGGARALGLGEVLGSIAVGKRADLTAVRIDPDRHGAHDDDPIGALVWSSQPADVLGVWIAGERRRGGART